jgi:hypothetical protein
MGKYEVSGNDLVFGIYEALSAQDARDAAAIDAGYKSEAAMEAELDAESALVAVEVEEWVAWHDENREEIVSFHAPIGGTCDIVSMAADALGVDPSEELNVTRA